MNEEILADRRTLQILGLVQTPHSAHEIAAVLGFGQADVYRRLRKLNANGFLLANRVRSQATGRQVRMWVTTVSKVWITFWSGAPRMQVVQRTEIAIELAQETRT